MATKVKLRHKAISGNRKSLYLDFYPAIPHPETGKPTRREFLGLYLFDNPKKPFDKQCNKETLQLAENIRAKRQIEIQAENYGFLNAKLKAETDFVQYFKQIVETKTGGNKEGWQTAFIYFKTFTGGKLTLSNLNVNLCNDFREYLLTAKRQRGIQSEQITQSSARAYYNKFKAALKQAYKKGLIEKDLSTRIDGISEPEVQREYLTLEQLQALVKTECNNHLLKRAALFSALTGLRFSDISKLVWSEVHYSELEGYFLQFTQQKTKGVEVLPISEQAYSLLGEPKEPTNKVFEGLIYSAYLNVHLKQWILRAGITKNITFHCFRHTFATLQLSKGTDIYTVSKMLGHRELKTTQIYAKIIDQTKRAAADKIKLDF
ncbi:MAG: site-specific integrase [Sphingobacteriales bacterium]|nr:MAG: site-specific integrase [Sphingobacteriales bacterium]